MVSIRGVTPRCVAGKLSMGGPAGYLDICPSCSGHDRWPGPILNIWDSISSDTSSPSVVILLFCKGQALLP